MPDRASPRATRFHPCDREMMSAARLIIFSPPDQIERRSSSILLPEVPNRCRSHRSHKSPPSRCGPHTIGYEISVFFSLSRSHCRHCRTHGQCDPSNRTAMRRVRALFGNLFPIAFLSFTPRGSRLGLFFVSQSPFCSWRHCFLVSGSFLTCRIMSRYVSLERFLST